MFSFLWWYFLLFHLLQACLFIFIEEIYENHLKSLFKTSNFSQDEVTGNQFTLLPRTTKTLGENTWNGSFQTDKRHGTDWVRRDGPRCLERGFRLQHWEEPGSPLRRLVCTRKRERQRERAPESQRSHVFNWVLTCAQCEGSTQGYRIKHQKIRGNNSWHSHRQDGLCLTSSHRA